MDPVAIYKVAPLFGTRVAETILASVHVRTHQQAGHMGASDLVKATATHLARRGPFSNRASFVKGLLLLPVAFPGSRFSPRSAYAAATSGPKHRRCNVHNELTWNTCGPTASLAAGLHPRPGGQPSHPR
jgi:hypothetical protein